jgi:hypothetical protein
MHRERWQVKLANLRIELALAEKLLLEAERTSRIEHVERARELIALLTDEISEHRRQSWCFQDSAESADHESKTALN